MVKMTFFLSPVKIKKHTFLMKKQDNSRASFLFSYLCMAILECSNVGVGKMMPHDNSLHRVLLMVTFHAIIR